MKTVTEFAVECHKAYFLDNPQQCDNEFIKGVAEIIKAAMDAASVEMRERCATLARDYPEEAWDLSHGIHDTPRQYVVETSEQITAAIRALPLTKGSE